MPSLGDRSGERGSDWLDLFADDYASVATDRDFGAADLIDQFPQPLLCVTLRAVRDVELLACGCQAARTDATSGGASSPASPSEAITR